MSNILMKWTEKELLPETELERLLVNVILMPAGLEDCWTRVFGQLIFRKESKRVSLSYSDGTLFSYS